MEDPIAEVALHGEDVLQIAEVVAIAEATGWEDARTAEDTGLTLGW